MSARPMSFCQALPRAKLRCLALFCHLDRFDFFFPGESLFMHIFLHPVLICLVGSVAVGCHRQNNPQRVRNAPAQQSPARGLRQAMVNACQLLTSADIEKVQAERVQNVSPNDQPKAAMAISQCYFTTATTRKSISVTVWQQVNATGPDPREFWRERFHGEREKDKYNEEEEEREKLRRRLVPVPNLGDEAFWSGTSIGSGSLYVLKGDCFFRIEIGGADDREKRISKTRAFAEAVLKRL
jgi:hypothetical protein